MKKILAFVALMAFLVASARGFEVRLGGCLGVRMVNDAALKDIYGSGIVYGPFLSVELGNGFGIGANYDLFAKNGTVKPFDEKARLKINAVEGFLSYALRLKTLRPYLRAGYGSYSYSQTVESSYTGGNKVSAKASAIHFAAGLAFFPSRLFYLAAEAKYIPLKVKPLTRDVDLGGWRISAGLGLRFVI